MRPDAYSGVRNGFYGMSRVLGSQCLYSTQCSNPSFCQQVEGLNILLLPNFTQANSLPVCMGDPSTECKIEYPCPIPPPAPFECDSDFQQVSGDIYTRMGAYECWWFTFRDVVIVVL